MQQMLMNQLQRNNPQAYSFINNAMQSGQQPEELLNKMMKEYNMTGTRLEKFKKQAQQAGVPTDVLNKLG